MLSPRACTGVGISTGRKIFDSWNVRNLRMRGMGSQVELSQEMKKIGKIPAAPVPNRLRQRQRS